MAWVTDLLHYDNRYRLFRLFSDNHASAAHHAITLHPARLSDSVLRLGGSSCSLW